MENAAASDAEVSKHACRNVMKMLFSSVNPTEARQMKRKLFAAGIKCELKLGRLKQEMFGAPSAPELLIENERDILRAMRLLGARRLNQMTMILPR